MHYFVLDTVKTLLFVTINLLDIVGIFVSLNQLKQWRHLKMNKISSFLFLVLLMSGVASGTSYQVGSFDPVRPDPATWTCYDHSINFARENPEWGVVSMSSNPMFR